jgi:hypothetical protein
MTNFPPLKYFSQEEFTHPEQMSHNFLLRLDSLRGYLQTPTFITSSTGGIHTPGSFHYKGLAVDFIVPGYKSTLASLWVIIERFGFGGIGIYPEWEYNGIKIGGFHVDDRPINHYQGARWIGIKSSKTNENKYIPLNIPNMKKHKILT